MNVYVESNFVLELALRQAQSESCQTLVDYAANGQITLVVPAYSLTEPYETITRRRKERAQVKRDVDAALRQLRRSSGYSDDVDELRDLTSVLISSANDERFRLDTVATQLVEVAEVISLDSRIIAQSLKHQKDFDFSPQDALVYASVMSHVTRSSSVEDSCFLNRDARDFEDQNVIEELGEWQCRLLTDFDNGLSFVTSQLRHPASDQ